ncbi:MAG: DUF4190 domain-containing protein [Thermoplasmatota archaeon]
MDYDPSPPSSSNYEYNEFQSTPQQSFDQQFAQAEMQKGSNGIALASMIFGIVNLFLDMVGVLISFLCFLTFVTSIIGLVMGIVGLKKSNETGVGKGFAIAGIATNASSLVLSILGVLLVFLWVGMMMSL